MDEEGLAIKAQLVKSGYEYLAIKVLLKGCGHEGVAMIVHKKSLL